MTLVLGIIVGAAFGAFGAAASMTSLLERLEEQLRESREVVARLQVPPVCGYCCDGATTYLADPDAVHCQECKSRYIDFGPSSP